MNTLLLLAFAFAGTEWPSVRGPNGNGYPADDRAPEEFSLERNLRFKVAIPSGNSSPVLLDGKLFLTHPLNGPTTPAPVTDGRHIYAFLPEFGLVSYTTDGKERWGVPMGPFDTILGVASSPAIAEGM